VIYKGSGYYSTDHRSKERERNPGSETAAAASKAATPGDA